MEWHDWLLLDHPNFVIVVAGRWEVVDRTYKGRWTNIFNSAYAAYVKSQLQLAVNVATAKGAHMVLMTAPCFDDSAKQPNGQPWPEDSAARLRAYNNLVREVAAANPKKVTLINLDALACPNGQYREFLDGVQVRTADGIHFTWAGGAYLGRFIWPQIISTSPPNSE